MINFKKLVEESYVLVTEATSTDPDIFANYWNDGSVFIDVRNFLQQKFKINPTWKNPDQIFPILADTYTRSSGDALIAFAQEGLFPLMDFVWFTMSRTPRLTNSNFRTFLTTVSLSGSSGGLTNSKNDTENIGRDFITSCKQANNGDTPANPLFGYIPSSAPGTSYIRILQKKIAQNTVGTLSLNNFNDLSIQKAFYGILENRRKVRTSVIKNENIPNSIKWVDGILQNPQAYAGQIQIPPEIAKLYDKVVATKLIEISNTMHEFYEAEVGLAQAFLSAVDDSDKPLPVQNTFMEFISNNSKASGTDKYIFDFGSVTGESPSLQSTTGGYIIKNIKNIDTPQAKDLIQELTEFANYVSEGEPSDIAGGLQGLARMAKGLSLGVPSMGSR